MNNHVYSTLFLYKKENWTKEAKKNREKKGITKHTLTKQQGHVTLSTELQSTALMLNFLAASKGLEKIMF